MNSQQREELDRRIEQGLRDTQEEFRLEVEEGFNSPQQTENSFSSTEDLDLQEALRLSIEEPQ